MTTKWTQKSLIKLFKAVTIKEGHPLTRKEWLEHPDTPSDMPVKRLFIKWNNFLVACGCQAYKPHWPSTARENSKKTLSNRKRENCHFWKGGKYITKKGYTQIYCPGHSEAKRNGYALEHRKVMSDYLERSLTTQENVHHKNGDRTDNSLSNLELWTKTQPSGQRVEDKIEWAIAFLKIYKPEALQSSQNVRLDVLANVIS